MTVCGRVAGRRRGHGMSARDPMGEPEFARVTESLGDKP